MIVATALATLLLLASAQAMIVILRRHSIDVRRPGPLVERLSNEMSPHAPPELEVIQRVVADSLSSGGYARERLWPLLAELADAAPHPTARPVFPPTSGDRRAWLSEQLDAIDAGYRWRQDGPIV